MSNDNQGPRRQLTIKPLDLLDDIARRIGFETAPDTTELYRLLEQVKANNRDLFFALESEISSVMGEAVDRSFAAGWKYREHPELLIFNFE